MQVYITVQVVKNPSARKKYLPITTADTIVRRRALSTATWSSQHNTLSETSYKTSRPRLSKMLLIDKTCNARKKTSQWTYFETTKCLPPSFRFLFRILLPAHFSINSYTVPNNHKRSNKLHQSCSCNVTTIAKRTRSALFSWYLRDIQVILI